MIFAKNYETTSTFVEVMQKKLWPLFSRHGVYIHRVSKKLCQCYFLNNSVKR